MVLWWMPKRHSRSSSFEPHSLNIPAWYANERHARCLKAVCTASFPMAGRCQFSHARLTLFPGYHSIAASIIAGPVTKIGFALPVLARSAMTSHVYLQKSLRGGLDMSEFW
jgi:hypothetical protein